MNLIILRKPDKPVKGVVLGSSVFDIIDEYKISLKNSELSKNTVNAYTTTLNLFRNWLADNPDIPQEVKKLKPKHLEQFFFFRKQQGTGTGTRQQNYIHLNLFFKWIEKRYRKKIKRNPMDNVPRIKYRPPHRDYPERDILDKLIQSFDTSTFEGVRNRFACTVLKETGVRASELLDLREVDIDIVSQVLTVQDGKGGKSRRIPFPEIVTIELLNYLTVRREHNNNHRAKLLITRQGELAYQSFLSVVKVQCEEIGISPITPHLFRHAYADYLKGEGFSDEAIMELLGWDTRTMLDHYARAKRKTRAIEEYHRKMSGPSKED